MASRRRQPNQLTRRQRAAIYARETHCYRCGNPVDKTLPTNHPLAPTVDHTHPRQHGGTNDPTNLHLMHRSCNSAKGTNITLPTHSRVW